MNPVLTNIGFFLAGAIVMLVVLLALGERRDNRNDVPAEPEPTPEPVAPVVAEPEPAAVPVVAVAPKVIPPWPKRVEDPDPVPVAWRARLEQETAPLFGKLPDHESVWRMPSWNLDDPFRTQMMRIIGGVPADELDVDLGDPQPLPGFEVDEAARRRLSLPPELVAEVTAALPSREKAEVSA